MPSFQFVILSLPGLADPALAIAGSRAGGLGILDLEHVHDEAAARSAIARLARYTQHACGLMLDGHDREFVTRVTSDLPTQVKTVILTHADPENLHQQVQLLHRRNLAVWLEVICLEQAQLGEQANVDGLVAKGQEAGGWIGEETTFILLQRLLARTKLPVWARGGIGLHTAAACYAAGAAGVVLDAQLVLTRESPLPEATKAIIAAMDGSETTRLGTELGEACHVYNRPGLPVLEELRQVAKTLAQDSRPRFEILADWHRAVEVRVGWGAPEEHLWLLGQDAAFAAPLARQFHTVGGVLEGLRQAVDTHVRLAATLRPLDENSPLARLHGTRYPIVQGPMTRVSDTAAFAARVADGGGLPFLALALLRAAEVRALLEETRRQLGDRPWGVGILGFVPLDLRQEQIEVIRAYHPPFALIAGGRPDQARSLEQDGIPTYLHVPSPGLLKMFLQDGVRRFVFEGRECGGHVGPRSSFVLWNTMIDVLLETLHARDAEACHVLFAGGIHDALSASMVATMAAPLAERGIRIGVLLGTAYLFTEEAVTSGAILPGFQSEALRCDRTVLLETGPGHATRCAPTPYVDLFEQEKQRLVQEGKSLDEVRQVLEDLNIGRLRIASKGITRHPGYGQDPGASKLITVSEAEQHSQGMYMIGQLAALRDRTCTIAELHHDIAVEGSRRLERLVMAAQQVSESVPAARPSEIAIVGMSCILPKAQDLQTYWENILNKVNAITEIPKDRWDWELYYDPDPKARDKIYSKWGGFIDDVPFDPVEYGMPPNSLPSIDPMQLLALKAASAALEDAGYLNRSFDRSHTSVILGASGGIGDLGAAYLLRSSLPLLFGDLASEMISKADGILPEWTEDSFAGLLLNVAAGRITNRFDFGGLNYIVDAACASSLAAVHLAVKELEAYNTDMVIVGGVDTVQNPFGYLCFSKTQALSPTGQARTFDASADGIVISEGVVMLVLKRLADAERDGDRIYAVIQGVGSSSDGKAKGLTAPRPEGQQLALQRTYAKAGISPTTVGLFEAHGTGTVVGDRTEALSLATYLEEAGAVPRSCAIGSVKSMIGHTKATAGVAGLAKVALALYHKVLPPTLGVTQPNPKARFGEGPLYINSETRPWIHGTHNHPRRAGVSAFGFGGTNFHAVVEEYTGDYLSRPAVLQRWPAELLIWSANSRQELVAALESLDQALKQGARPELRDLAYSLNVERSTLHFAQGKLFNVQQAVTLAIVATSLDDLQQKLAQACEALSQPGTVQIADPKGIYFFELPLARQGKVAFLFPGQGSQYPNMLRDLAVMFPEVREEFERADHVLAPRFPQPLSGFVFPPPAFTPEEERAQQQALTQTNIAQPALGAAGIALFHLLQKLGVQPDLAAGHSYGEYVALCAAGVFDAETLATLSEARGRYIIEAAKQDPSLRSGQDLGTMAAVPARPERVAEILDTLEGVWIANLNAPEQTIISGTRAGVARAVERLNNEGIQARSIPVACAFHSPIVAPAQQRLAEFLTTVEFAAPQLEVFSNTTAAPYPHDSQGITTLLAEHLVKPVRFADEVIAMYEAGARIFIEVGPRNVLTGLTRQILGERAHVALAVDVPGRPGLIQLQHALGLLAAHGVPVRLDRLFQGRPVRRWNLNSLVEETREKPLPPTTWLVNGGRAIPLHPAAGGKLQITDRSGQIAEGNRQPPIVSRHPSAVSQPPPAVSGQPSAVSQPLSAVGHQPSEAEQVMLQFQHLMNRFLDTQKNVMLAYLQGMPAEMTADHRPPTADGRQQGETVPAAAVSDQPLAVVHHLPTGDGSAQQEARSSPVDGGQQPALSRSPEGSEGAAEGAAVISKEQLRQRLLQLVSERTGYPPEMLDLDVDIEADLGIDSIKRVEILGALQRACIPPDRQIGQVAMEQLASIKTLRGIVDWVDNVLNVQRSNLQPSTFNGDEVSRFTLTAVDAPPANTQSVRFVPDRVFLITDDGRGIAQAITEQVRARGGRAVLVRLDSGNSVVEAGVYRTDLANPAAVAELVAMVRQQQGPIGGIVHLLPLRDEMDFEAMDLAAWRNRLQREVKSLFYLARAAAEDLKRVGKAEGAWLVAATAMGGAWGMEQESEGAWEQRSQGAEEHGGRGGFSQALQHLPTSAPFPGQGGIAGLVKTLALEWPTVRCKVVDLDLENPPSTLAEQLLQEMATGDGQVEVRYTGSRRQILQPKLIPLDQDGPAQLAIHSDWVVLVTGGARGITAEVACELAERYRPTLLLVGSSSLPEPEESPQTAGRSSPQELKAALMNQMRQAGEPVTVTRVEAAYNRLLKDREIRQNLARMQHAGATVRYYRADVRDEQAMVNLIEGIYQEYGRLDGVVHGAGIIEDKLIEDKTPDSYDRVFDPKADGAFILSRALRAGSLKFLVLFSSVAGAFGNRGQCDYAAANEVLNKLAIHLDRRWPGRVVAINWGPWAKTGMVSPELQRQFAERGVQLIPPQVGRRLFDQEIRFGRKGDAEVVVGGGPWAVAEKSENASFSRYANRLKPAFRPEPSPLPLLVRTLPVREANGSVEYVRRLDPSHDLYLLDHQLDGKPVLPLAMAMELMAEVVQHAWPDLQVVGINDLHLLRGIIIENSTRDIRVVTRPRAQPSQDQLGIDVDVEILEADAPGWPFYRATVHLGDRFPEPPPYKQPSTSDLHPFPLTVAEAYRQWLFHDSRFQCISRIEGIDEQRIMATIIPSSPEKCLAETRGGQWLIDPIVIDSGPQLAILWARAYLDMTALPSRVRTYRRFGSLSESTLRCDLQIQASTGGHVLHSNVYFVGSDGRLLGLIEDLESNCSQALNRLIRQSRAQDVK